MALRTRYASWFTDMLRAGIAVHSRPLMRILFADVLAGMELELLSRELPLLAEDAGGHLVTPAWGLQ